MTRLVVYCPWCRNPQDPSRYPTHVAVCTQRQTVSNLREYMLGTDE